MPPRLLEVAGELLGTDESGAVWAETFASLCSEEGPLSPRTCLQRLRAGRGLACRRDISNPWAPRLGTPTCLAAAAQLSVALPEVLMVVGGAPVAPP